MGLLFLRFVGLGITPTFDKEFIINDAFAKMPHFVPEVYLSLMVNNQLHFTG